MDKQTIEQAAVEYANKRYETGYNTGLKGQREAFCAGAEFATLKWISVNDGTPCPSDPNSSGNDILCLVVRKGYIEMLSWNVHEVCWDDANGDDYRCDFLDVTKYLPFYLLPNP